MIALVFEVEDIIFEITVYVEQSEKNIQYLVV